MKIELSEQVVEFIRDCPPEPRRWLREALRKLADEKGDIKALEGELTGYYRLRINRYRIIFRYRPPNGNERSCAILPNTAASSTRPSSACWGTDFRIGSACVRTQHSPK